MAMKRKRRKRHAREGPMFVVSVAVDGRCGGQGVYDVFCDV